MADLSEKDIRNFNKAVESLATAASRLNGGNNDVNNLKSTNLNVNPALENVLKRNGEYLDILKKIKKTEDDILKTNIVEDKLQKQRTVYLDKQKDLQNIKSVSTTNFTKTQLKAHEKMTFLLEKEVKQDALKFKLLEHQTAREKERLKIVEKIKSTELENIKNEEKRLAREKSLLDFKEKSKNKIIEFGKKTKEFTGDQLKQLSGISGGFLGFMEKTLSNIYESDSAMAKLSANYALTKGESTQIKDNISHAAITTSFWGVKMGDLAKAQQTYTDELGRSVIFTESNMVNLSKMGVATGIGAEGAALMAASFEKFGLDVDSTVNRVSQLVKLSKANGLSSSLMVKRLSENIKIANSYTFNGGLNSLQKTLVFAEKLKINMSTIASLADKISTPEGAIETAAGLQVLGGSFANMSDPLKLLNQGITDMNGLTETYSKMLKGVASINKETGELEINGYDRIRLKAAATAMGVSYEDMMETARLSAKRDVITSQFKLSPVLNTASEDVKNIIASLAQKKDGKWSVNVGGQTRALMSLSKEDIEKIQPKADSDNLKTVAENTLGISDIIQNGFEAIMTKFVNVAVPLIYRITEILTNIFGGLSRLLGNTSANVPKDSAYASSGVLGAKAGYAGAKLGGSILAQQGLKLGGKTLSKWIPGVGAAISGGLAYNDYKEGDYTGMVLNGLSGAANLANFIAPGFGTGASIGIDAINAYREYNNGMNSVNDGIISRDGKVTKINNGDDVLAMKSGGPIDSVLKPIIDVNRMYGGVTPSYGTSYNGSQNNGFDKPFKIDLSGNATINLVTGGNNIGKIDINELTKNPHFMKQLSRMISRQINIDDNGGTYSGKLGRDSFA